VHNAVVCWLQLHNNNQDNVNLAVRVKAFAKSNTSVLLIRLNNLKIRSIWYGNFLIRKAREKWFEGSECVYIR